MFGLLKFLFYSCVAVVVGVVIGTVPFGGKTVAERIAAVYQTGPSLPAASSKRSPPPKALARAAPRPKAPVPAPTRAGPLTAGAANSPDRHTESDRAALDQLLAAKVKQPR